MVKLENNKDSLVDFLVLRADLRDLCSQEVEEVL